LAEGHFAAGAVAGEFTSAAAVRDGLAAGLKAAAYAGHDASGAELPPLEVADDGFAIEPLWQTAQKDRAKAFIDFQNDVSVKDLTVAYQEGYRSVEHLKRYTTLGMGTDQGKTSNINALAIMAGLRDIDIPEAGTTTFRPPYSPVAMGALAGR